MTVTKHRHLLLSRLSDLHEQRNNLRGNLAPFALRVA
jgi:hypothetical protein